MNLWKRLLNLFREEAEQQQRTFALDARLEQSLRQLADQEKRPPEEILQVLIEAGLQYRRQNEEAWRCWKLLTPREQEVAALVCLGYTNRQIASRLGVTPETIKTHVRNLLVKFNLRHRNDLRERLAGWDFSAWE
ncbi:MAG: LuxR C-terminal-related transcriptional regulator [Bellilinea sp.]|nr:LuxR C-terminal-related transcriptional regulator [Bellilinea sp.]